MLNKQTSFVIYIRHARLRHEVYIMKENVLWYNYKRHKTVKVFGNAQTVAPDTYVAAGLIFLKN